MKKRRFASFLFTILLTFGVVFASVSTPSFAEEWTYSVSVTTWYGNNATIARCGLGSSTWYQYVVINSTNLYTVTFDFSSYIYAITSSWSAGTVYRYYTYTYEQNGSSVVFSPGAYYSSLTEARNNSIITLENPDPTPTPTPAPTATPSAPTPTPGAPTPPPSESNYTNFFNKLTTDAQSAINAIYISWQMSNNGFYTSIFFIGLPLLLALVGLVSYIVFGGDDD